MTTHIIRRSVFACAWAAAAVLLPGCGTNPTSLRAPEQVTCINVQEPISFQYIWAYRLERGPYWSEKVDERGTYYRAPVGGVGMLTAKGDPVPGHPVTNDGGVFIPNDPNEPWTIYRYISTANVPPQVPAADASCDRVAFAKDPVSSGVSLVSFGAAGAAGGTAGALIARSAGGASRMSYGQAAGSGAVGGLAAGLIIAGIINAEAGNIIGMAIKDPVPLGKLKAQMATRQPLAQVDLHPAAGIGR